MPAQISGGGSGEFPASPGLSDAIPPRRSRLRLPNSRAPIMFVYPHFLYTIERRGCVVPRSVLHGLTF